MVAFLLLPSFALAVIVTVFPFPAFFAFTTPLLLTVAYFLLLLLQFTALFLALEGDTTDFNVIVWLAFNLVVFPVILILLTPGTRICYICGFDFHKV